MSELHRRHLVPAETARMECYLSVRQSYPQTLELYVTMTEAGIKNGSTLLLDYRLRGGSRPMPGSFEGRRTRSKSSSPWCYMVKRTNKIIAHPDEARSGTRTGSSSSLGTVMPPGTMPGSYTFQDENDKPAKVRTLIVPSCRSVEFHERFVLFSSGKPTSGIRLCTTNAFRPPE